MTKRLPLLVAVAIGLAASVPLWSLQIPEGADSLLHLFRLAQVDALIEEGILFSRWAPDLALGYGYPLFNYYAPASYYLAELGHLAGLALSEAFVMAFLLLLVLASVGAYLWASDLVGDANALVTAAAYAFAPYLLSNILHRGALAEVMVQALAPFALWAAHRSVATGQSRYRTLTAFLVTVIVVTHNISALILVPLIVIYLLTLHVHQAAGNGFARLRTALVSASRDLWMVLLGIGLATWYWLPALGEQGLVQIGQVFLPGMFQYENNFLSVSELLAGPFFLDVKLINQQYPRAIHLVVVLLALLGLVGLRGRRLASGDRFHIVFAGVSTLLFCFMTLPITLVIWDRLPLIKFLQFPWRFLGLISLMTALLAGYGLEQLRGRLAGSRITAAASLPLAVLAIGVYAIPWSFVEFLEPVDPLTREASIRHELETGTVGMTSTGEYLPVRVQELPAADQVLNSLSRSRLAKDRLPAQVAVRDEAYETLAYRLETESSAPFTAIFNTFFFEGWQATIDGEETIIAPTQTTGLISVEVPAGDHRVDIRFGQTGLRRAATAISLLCLPLLAATLWFGRRQDRVKSASGPAVKAPLRLGIWGSILGALALILLSRSFYFNTLAPKRTPFDGNVVKSVEHPLHVRFGDQLVLLGSVQEAETAADRPLRATLYWGAESPITENVSVSLFVTDQNGHRVGQSDKQHIGHAPTSHWTPGEYARDEHEIDVAAGTPPGTYQLQVALYRYGRPEERLDVLDAAGNPGGQSYQIGEVSLLRPRDTWSVADLEPEKETNREFLPGLHLVGTTLQRQLAWAGESVTIDTYWQSEAKTSTDLILSLSLQAADGTTAPIGEVEPVPDYPTSLWQAGDLWRGLHTLILPASLTPGRYGITLGSDFMPAYELGALEVLGPEHLMARPSVAHEQNVAFGSFADLIGYDAPVNVEAGTTFSVELVWQVRAETQDSLKSFVQLLDGEGRYVAGSDQIPAQWNRPTTGWVSGEYIVDRHEVRMPDGMAPGTYTLIVGLYHEDSLQRVLTTEGADHALLKNPIIVEES